MLELNLLNSSNHKMASGFYLVGQVQVIAAGWSETVSKLRKCGVIDYRCLRWMWKWAVGLHTHAVDRHPSRRPSEGLQRGRELPRVTQQASDIFFHFMQAPRSASQQLSHSFRK